MSESIPFLGSKISLISKSEIRYEGILYTIDAHDSIIVLTKVQIFGTEDRTAERRVPPKNEVLEYIIFRGADIKQIEVCDPTKQIASLHNDPAIVSFQVQQHSAPAVATSYPGASFSHQPLGPIGSVGSYYGNYNQPLTQQPMPSSGFPIGVSQPSELSSGIGTSVGGVAVEPQSPPGSSHAIPAPVGAPPQSQSGMLSQSQSGMISQSRQDVLAGSRSSTPGASRKSPVADAGVQASPPPPQQIEKKRPPPQATQRPQQQTPERQVSRESQGQGQGQEQVQVQEHDVQTQMQGNPPRRTQYQGQNGQFQGNRQGYQNYYQGGQGQYRGGNMNRGRAPRRPSQPRGRGGGVFNQWGGRRQSQQRFDKEFDFEQANEEFEELRMQLAKTKISEGEKKDDSGHETATTGDESEDSTSSVYYDKTKSFFDSISCEALERSKGKSQRSDWRQERKINVQTFGVATARRGYYPRGRGYYNRGGYYRNYNQGYYRGGSANYRGSRGGGSNVDPSRTNSASGAMGQNSSPPVASSYSTAVRSAVSAK